MFVRERERERERDRDRDREREREKERERERECGGVAAGANRGMFEGFTSMITRSRLSVNTCGGRTHTHTHSLSLSFFPHTPGERKKDRVCVCVYVCVRPPQVFTDRCDRVIIEVKPSNMPRFAPASTPQSHRHAPTSPKQLPSHNSGCNLHGPRKISTHPV